MNNQNSNQESREQAFIIMSNILLPLVILGFLFYMACKVQ